MTIIVEHVKKYEPLNLWLEGQNKELEKVGFVVKFLPSGLKLYSTKNQANIYWLAHVDENKIYFASWVRHDEAKEIVEKIRDLLEFYCKNSNQRLNIKMPADTIKVKNYGE